MIKPPKILFLVFLSLGFASCVLRNTPEPELLNIPEEPPTAEMVEEEEAEVPKPEPVRKSRPTFQLKTLPEGWTVDRHPVAKWGMSLPNVMSNVLDSAQTVEYWEEIIDLPIGYKLPP